MSPFSVALPPRELVFEQMAWACKACRFLGLVDKAMERARSLYGRRIWKSQEIADLLYRAFENERALDLRYRTLNSVPEDDLSIPNYKVMKQLALRRRLGKAYAIVLALAPWLLILAAPLQWILALAGGVIGQRLPASAPSGYRIYPTTEQAEALIVEALRGDDLPVATIPTGPFRLGRMVGIRSVLQAVYVHILLWIELFQSIGRVRRDMILHSRDAFVLAMMAEYAVSSDEIFVTDDHYQRWSFLFSHLARDFRIVQHGFLDTDVIFPNCYGVVSVLYIREQLFEAQFGRFYSIKGVRIFSPEIEYQEGGRADSMILLASSFPAIDREIEFVRALKARTNIPVTVKFHPVHVYDSRKESLSAMADAVAAEYGYPRCKIFVSDNSFMEFDYRHKGIPTVSIARAGGVLQAVQQTLDILEAQ